MNNPEQNSDDLRRSQDLFERLASEEPPLDRDSDTAPSRTAPREIAQAGDTRPMAAVSTKSGSGKYAVTLAVGVVLIVSLVVTMALLLLSGDDEPEVIPVSQATASPTIPTQAPTLTLPPPTPVPTIAPASFVVDIPPTAAADERGAWLLNPVDEGSHGNGVIRGASAFTITGQSSRLEVIPYTIERGDTLSSLGSKFGLDFCTIIWSNPRNKTSPLRPGTIIDIMPVDGVLYRIEKQMTIQEVADITAVNPYDIIDSPFNELLRAIPETVLVEGMKIVVPGGQGGDCNVWSPGPSASGITTDGSGNYVYNSGGVGSGSLWGCSYGVDNPGAPGMNPVGGRYEFFQAFNAAHTGVDLSAISGTPVIASGNGAVAFAGWNDYGYGNAIVIDHGGMYTLYAHLSSINVSCGQSVNGGDVIGNVGSTGRSSGPHLHFEIRDGGFNPMNPVGMLPL